jgi:methionyl-tRNA synthetase
MKAFVSRGLQDFSISRLKSKMPWGISVPNDPDHVMYVWFDALTNYINTLGFPDTEGDFEKYWVLGTPTQYCGKDNTRFQSAMWQAMLMASGLPNSSQIVVNGFVLGEGGVKMSKTLGNVVDPKEIVEEYGTDALRYFLLREISTFEDSSFSKERFKEAYNANLANGLGNLASRILTLSEKYLESCPEIPESSIPEEFFLQLEKFDIKSACDLVWDRVNKLDKRIQETEPFKVVKVDLEKGKELISEMVLELYTIARMLNPIMPGTNEKLKALIKANKKPENPLFLRKE